MTMKQFLSRHPCLHQKHRLVDSNPHMNDMPEGSTHWKITLRNQGRQLTTHYSMGPAHTEEPTLEDVLDCLASDAAGIENSPRFDQWAGEYGYDPDSRKAERVYKVCQKQAEGLLRLLSSRETYDSLLFDTERS